MEKNTRKAPTFNLFCGPSSFHDCFFFGLERGQDPEYDMCASSPDDLPIKLNWA